MTHDLETELREALRAHTADVLAPAGLLGDARRGASRRRRRTRLAVAATPLAVVGVVVAGLFVVPRLSYSPPGPGEVAAALPAADRALLAGATEGDLADDTGYLAAVRAAWAENRRTSMNADRGIFEHPVGDPTVLWAGTTPAGPAAVVAQVFDLREHDNVQLEREGPAMLWGFVGPAADGGAPRVVADGYPVPGAPDTEGALLGADRQVLLVRDRGRPVDVSWALAYSDDGRAGRRWTPLRFSEGVAVLTRPAGTEAAAVRLRVRDDYADVGNLGDDPMAGNLDRVDRRLRWDGTAGRPVFPVGADAGSAWGGRLPAEEDAAGALSAGLAGRLPELYPEVNGTAESFWYAAGSTPDGSRLVAGERVLDDDPSRVYAVLRSPAGGPVRAASAWVRADRPVPVLVPLPDGQGWLVAAKGKALSWRTGTGDWTEVGRDAALLPAAATEVRADGGEAVRLR